jgi:hypothetical protein
MGILQRSLTLARAVVALLLVGMASAAGAGAAVSCDRFASPSGSDGSGHGSFRKPYRTPQKLANSLASGQTGCFRGGTYRFSETVVSKANVTLAPYRGQAVTLRGSIKVPPPGHGSTIMGLKLDGAGGKATSAPDLRQRRGATRQHDHQPPQGDLRSGLALVLGPAAAGVVIERNRSRLRRASGDQPSARHLRRPCHWHGHPRQLDLRQRRPGCQLYPDAQHSRVIGNVIDSNGEGIVFSGAGSGFEPTLSRATSSPPVRWNAYSGAPANRQKRGAPQLRPCAQEELL